MKVLVTRDPSLRRPPFPKCGHRKAAAEGVQADVCAGHNNTERGRGYEVADKLTRTNKPKDTPSPSQKTCLVSWRGFGRDEVGAEWEG